MDTKEKNDIKDDTSFLLAEYNALRAETLKRLDIQSQIITFTIVVFGTILGVGFQGKIVAITFSYPILAMFLSISWSHNDYRIRQIGNYIKNRIEIVAGAENMRWEHYMTTDNRPLYPWSSRGIFSITQLLAIVAGVYVAVSNDVSDASFVTSLIFAIISFILTFFMLKKSPVKPIIL